VFQPPDEREVEHTIDDVVVIGKGKIIETGCLSEELERSGEDTLEKAFLKLTASAVEYRAGDLPAYGGGN
jgi:ABC-type Na+ transport system ATPase subunit NatA